MATNKLTVAKVKTLSPGLHGDGGGLWLRVSPAGGRYWVFRFMVAGKSQSLGLGNADLMTLQEARDAAIDARKLIRAGKNPVEARRTSLTLSAALKPVKSFGDCADEYFAAQRSSYGNEKYAEMIRLTLTRDVAVLRPMDPSEIDAAAVVAVLKPVWERTPKAARRIREKIEGVLDYATVHGHRTGDNPARWAGSLEHLLPKNTGNEGHHAALPYKDAPAFFKALMKVEGVAARALEWTVLTAARSGETFGAVWDEIDADEMLWIVPATRMKTKATMKSQPHIVPIVPRGREVLAQAKLLRCSEYVFPGVKKGKPLSHIAMSKVLDRMGVDNATVHGFRSTSRDWAGDCTEFPREIAEAALAHRVGNVVEAAYRRGSALAKRRDLMDAWQNYLLG